MHRLTFHAPFLAAVLIGLACLVPAEAAEQLPTEVRVAHDAAVEAPAPLAVEVVQVGEQRVEVWAHRAANPRATLVFENGLMLPLTTWQAVVQPLVGEADILLYNRPGVGSSELPGESQDPTDTARRLHELLRAKELQPPFIVIGHSLGGLYAQLFARLYPHEVGALLLVDALPPGVVKPFADFPWYTQAGLRLLAPPYVQREIAHAHAIGEVLLDGTISQGKPMIRLVAAHDPTLAKPEGLVKDLLKGVVYAEDFGIWAVDPEVAERRLDLVYPHSSVRSVPVRHRMQEAAPALVIDAIRELIGKTGAGSKQASAQ